MVKHPENSGMVISLFYLIQGKQNKGKLQFQGI